jgi:formylglycine-generating enzyme required for sulfatase activity
MDNQARQLLKQVIHEHGFAIVHDSNRLASLLKDYAKGQFKREIFLLVLAAREGVVDTLLLNENLTLKLILEQSITRLQTDFGIEKSSAIWAVNSWVLVLDLHENTIIDFKKITQTPKKHVLANKYVFVITLLVLLTLIFFIAIAPSKDYEPGQVKFHLPARIKSNPPSETPELTNASDAVPLPENSKTIIPEPQTIAATTPIEPEMVVIPAGTYTMGCVDSRDHVCTEDEKPAHKKIIAKFLLAKTEITFNQWEHCVADKSCEQKNDKGWGRGLHPVIYVSWNDAQKYLEWLNKQTGKNYRLPTEAEWEYAVRGGNDTADPWGNSIRCNTVEVNKGCEDSKGTATVASNIANAYGLYDMTGNVWEWVQDCYHLNYQNAPVDGKEWKTDCPVNATRVARGGMWFYQTGQKTRSADRYQFSPDYRSFYLGFRPALSLP